VYAPVAHWVKKKFDGSLAAVCGKDCLPLTHTCSPTPFAFPGGWSQPHTTTLHRCAALHSCPPPTHTHMHTCTPVSLPAAAPPVVQAVQTPATAQPQCPARSRTTGRSRGAPSRTTLQQLTHRHDVRGPGCAPIAFDTASVPCLPLSTGLFYGWMHFLRLYAHAHRHSIHEQ
jgi:hypothetical protein